MAKNKKKNRNKNGDSMDVSATDDGNHPQAMDVSEERASNSSLGVNRKIKKPVQMRRAKKLRKQKAIERAISCSDKSELKVSKSTDKKLRIQSAKTLYD